MGLRFVLDENCRGTLWDAIVDHNGRAYPTIDATRVGDPPDRPLGSLDPAILAWAEDQGRILVSLDKATLLRHLRDHLQAGRHSPGLFLLRPGARLVAIVASLAYIGEDGQPEEFADVFTFIP